MEQAQQNTAQELTAQAIPQQAVEDACFHSLGLIGRNCEYLEQHLARVGADAQSLQAVSLPFTIAGSGADGELTEEDLRAIIDKYTEGRFLWIFGEKRVNVLLVNLALDGLL